MLRSVLSALLLLSSAFPALAQVDPRSIATQVHVGPFDPVQTPLGIGNGSIQLTLEPFEAAAVTWRSKARAENDPVVRVRVSPDANAWSDWQTLRIDGDITRRDEGSFATGIAHFGSSNRFLQLTIDRAADAVTVTTFPEAAPRTHTVSNESIQFGSLQIRSRIEWGCPDGETSSHGAPSYTTVTHAVLHHTAGANDLPDWDAEVRNDWYYHVFTNGWADIGYNFLIAPNGVIYEGRAGGDGVVGAHFSCRNGNTVGIALLGTYSTVKPTDAAIASLEALLREICRKYSIDPSAVKIQASSGLTLPTILGHRDGNPYVPAVTCTITECPGDMFYAMIPAVRNEVACAPSIEVQPNSMTIAPGGSATLSVVAKGSEPLTYQWYAGASGATDSPVPGATSSSVTLSPTTLTKYWVRVTTNCGSVDSAAAIVNVSTAGRTRSVRH